MAKYYTISEDEYTIGEHHFKTADGKHKIYVQEWGKKGAKPILYIHGGPGGGCHDGSKTWFDPAQHRVIFVDQRGCGKSTPLGSLENNQTDFLIEDFEMIRTKLGIDAWTLTGNSWGSTLALCYGIKHADKISSMLIRGIFLATKSEIDWLHKGGFKKFFPEVWDRYIEQTPKEHHENPGDYHSEKATAGDVTSAKAYIEAEGSLLSLYDKMLEFDTEDYDPSASKIESHYLSNGCFFAENFIIKNASKLTMPVAIVQGRYDMICPPISAYRLHQSLPNSTLSLPIAGHASADRASLDVTKAILSQIK